MVTPLHSKTWVLPVIAEFSYDIWDGLKITANGSYNVVNKSYKLYRKDLQYNANKYDGPIRLTKSHTKEIRRQGDILLNYDKTFAQMSTEEKNEVSHRARAVRKLAAYLHSAGK